MGWGWVSELIKGIVAGLRVLFGTDKPTETIVDEGPKEDGKDVLAKNSLHNNGSTDFAGDLGLRKKD